MVPSPTLLNMNVSRACLFFRLAQRLCPEELKLRKYNVAPRDMMPEIKKKMMEALTLRIKNELR